MRSSALVSSLLCACAGCGVFSTGDDGARTVDLRTDRRVDAANVVAPTFSWKMESARRGAAQSAYRLRAWEGDGVAGTPVYDTGVCSNSVSVAIPWRGPALKSATRYTWEVTTCDERGTWLAPVCAKFETGLLSTNDWAGSAWISAADAREATADELKLQMAAPGTSCFVKDVPNGRRVVQAWWTVSGLGVFEAYVNGKPISRLRGGVPVRDAVLKPGFTHPQKTKHAFTYDVTHLVRTGAKDANVFSAMVSAGWWRDQIVGSYRGKKSAFRGMLILRHADGGETRVGTDASWLAGVAGPVVKASIFDGEVYDARIATPWMADAAQAVGFKPAVVNREFGFAPIPMEGPAIVRRGDLALWARSAYVWKGVAGATSNRYGIVKIQRRCPRDKAIVLEPGETLVVDFGQNAAAVPWFEAAAERGVTMEILPAEMLNDGKGAKSRGNDGPQGSVYRQNLRAIANRGARAVYTFAGTPAAEQWSPEFSFFGYRYVSITATGRVRIAQIFSIPVTSVSRDMETGRLSTGVRGVDKLFSNVRWGMYSNYLSVPTDCPQRNERLGWMADTQVFTSAGGYLADTYGFLSKWMRDVRDSQLDDGSFTSVAPLAQYGADAKNGERLGWSDAGVIVPYVLWRRFGDLAVVCANWKSMDRFLDLLDKNPYTSKKAQEWQYCDWLSFEMFEACSGGDRGENRAPAQLYWRYLGGCYWLWDAEMMRDMARALGDAAAIRKYEAMSAKARAYMRKTFLDPKDGMLPAVLRDMQTPALFALKLDLFEKPAAAEATRKAFLKNLVDHDDCLATGFLGTSILMDAVTYDVASPETAYALLLQRKNPSWLYSVDQGATTIWERWNSYVKATGFGPVSMNSFNHYAYGAVVSWMYGTMAGIREDAAVAGFKRFTLAPLPDRRLGHVDASFDSPYGKIESKWKYRMDGTWRWNFTVPPNTTAVVVEPGGKTYECGPGKYCVTKRLP